MFVNLCELLCQTRLRKHSQPPFHKCQHNRSTPSFSSTGQLLPLDLIKTRHSTIQVFGKWSLSRPKTKVPGPPLMPELEEIVLAGITRLEEEITQKEDLGGRTQAMKDLWQIFGVLGRSPNLAADEMVDNFLQHCFMSDPVLARASPFFTTNMQRIWSFAILQTTCPSHRDIHLPMRCHN